MRTPMLLFVLLLMSGCGTMSSTPTAHLAGTVTIKGKSIPADADAALSFSPSGGGEPVSVPIVDGRYDSRATPQGSVRVNFYISRPTGPVKTSERTGLEYRDAEDLVPPEYATGVHIEVTGNNLNHNFEL